MKSELADRNIQRDSNPVQQLEKALQLHQQGRLDRAAAIYRQILLFEPLNSDALHLSGVVAMQKGDHPSAIELIKQAIHLVPDQPIFHSNLGNAYRDSGRCQEAIVCYQKALAIKPDLAETYINLGVAYHQCADLEQAASAFQQALTLKPDSAEAYYNLGNMFKEQRRFDLSIACYQQAVALNSNFVEAYYNLANSLEQQSRFDEAIECLKQCLRINPQWAEAYNNLGNLLKHKGLPDAALSYYRKAVQLKPELYAAYSNLGNALKDRGCFAEAIACYKRALHFHPQYAEAYQNMGVAFSEQDRLEEGIECFQKAIELRPDFAEAYNFMGLCFDKQAKTAEAISCFKKAIQLQPHYAEAYGYLIHQYQHTCNWQRLIPFAKRLDELNLQATGNSQSCTEPPFICMARNSDLTINLQTARSWSRRLAQPYRHIKFSHSSQKRSATDTRLRIGYLSCDFHNHATAHLICSLFGLHDRRRFKVFGYSYGPDDNSLYRQKIRTHCDCFLDVRNLSDIDTAQRIYDDGIDILIDLKGHTKGARLGILACRPAPIQVHYLGFPGTSGADFIDYLITDKIVTPIEHAAFYSEKLAFLPHSYQVNDHQQEIAACDWTKKELGLPNMGFVFSSFNLPYKIDPLIFDCWMRILNQVPHSVLWLYDASKTSTANLKQEARARGIDPCRLVFGAKQPKAEHLARLRRADLILDTRVVNGHTTTSDALWAGVPVISLQGHHFASRVSASLLNAIGLSELTTHNLTAYEHLAIRLATHPGELEEIKAKLARNRLLQPLFDTPGFIAYLEAAYCIMWRIFKEGRAPQQFEVIES